MTTTVKKIKSLVDSLDFPEKDDMLVLVETLNKESQQRAEKIKMVQQIISDIRLDLKYIKFDLESTRDERDQLLKELGRS